MFRNPSLFRSAAVLFGAACLAGLVACEGDALSPEPPQAPQAHLIPATVPALANSWATKAAMPTARGGLVAANVDGIVYAIGGAAEGWGGNGPTLRTVEAYSKAANAWSSFAPLPSSRAYANGASVIGGKIYVTGGLYRPPPIIGKPPLEPIPTRSLFVYDPASNIWSRKTDMPVAGYAGSSAVINGKLYVALSGIGSKSGTALYRYDPGTDTWSQRATAPRTHRFGVAAAINGKLYVAGGWISKSAVGDLDVYNPATDSWVSKAAMPTLRSGAAGRVINGKFYVAGGLDSEGQYSKRLEVYDPATNTWVKKPDLPTVRWGAGAAVAGGALYIIGGETPGVSKANEVYIP